MKKSVKKLRNIRKPANAVMAAVLVGFTLLSMQAYAMQSPVKLASDPRIEMVSYSDNNVVPITGTPFIVTQITFSPDEHIQLVQVGDADAWTVAPISKSAPNLLFIKPTIFDSHTNMTVFTDQHTYHFKLDSVSSTAPSGAGTYAVNFNYPDLDALQASIAQLQKDAQLSPSLDPSQYNSDYTYGLFSDKRILPIHVFDDGKFTYFQLQPNQSIPAVFAVDSADGKEAIVNYRTQGSYIIVDRLSPQFTLRDGSKTASIFNDKMIQKLQSN